MTFVFTAAEDDLLIDQVRLNAAIYDSSHPRHKNVMFKDELWKGIAEKVCRSVDDCKKRWKNIRDTYMKIKKKTNIGSTKTSKKPWALITRVAFMDNVEFERRTISNVSPCPSIVDESHTDDDINKDERNEQLSRDQNKTYSRKRIRSEADKLAIILSKRSKDKDTVINDIRSKNVMNSYTDDDVDLFFRSIAETVKRFSKKGIIESKLKVLNLISELEEKYSELT